MAEQLTEKDLHCIAYFMMTGIDELDIAHKRLVKETKHSNGDVSVEYDAIFDPFYGCTHGCKFHDECFKNEQIAENYRPLRNKLQKLTGVDLGYIRPHYNAE